MTDSIIIHRLKTYDQKLIVNLIDKFEGRFSIKVIDGQDCIIWTKPQTSAPLYSQRDIEFFIYGWNSAKKSKGQELEVLEHSKNKMNY